MAAFLSAGGEGSDGPEFFHKRHVCIDNLLCVVRDRRFRSIEFAFISVMYFFFFSVDPKVFLCHVFPRRLFLRPRPLSFLCLLYFLNSPFKYSHETILRWQYHLVSPSLGTFHSSGFPRFTFLRFIAGSIIDSAFSLRFSCSKRLLMTFKDSNPGWR